MMSRYYNSSAKLIRRLGEPVTVEYPYRVEQDAVLLDSIVYLDTVEGLSTGNPLIIDGAEYEIIAIASDHITISPGLDTDLFVEDIVYTTFDIYALSVPKGSNLGSDKLDWFTRYRVSKEYNLSLGATLYIGSRSYLCLGIDPGDTSDSIRLVETNGTCNILESISPRLNDFSFEYQDQERYSDIPMYMYINHPAGLEGTDVGLIPDDKYMIVFSKKYPISNGTFIEVDNNAYRVLSIDTLRLKGLNVMKGSIAPEKSESGAKGGEIW